MDLSELSVFDAARRKLHYASQRQRVLAQNVANGDTPGYRPMDLEPFSFSHTLAERSMSLRTSHPRHIAQVIHQGGLDSREHRNPYEASPTGNAVILEEQLLRQAENASQHQLASVIYRKQISMLRTAMTPPQG